MSAKLFDTAPVAVDALAAHDTTFDAVGLAKSSSTTTAAGVVSVDASSLVTPDDFDSICRFCLQRSDETELTSIFSVRPTRSAHAKQPVPGESDWVGMMGDLTGLEVCVDIGCECVYIY